MLKHKFLTTLLCSLLMAFSLQLKAQNLPGIAVADTEVSSSAKTLISLASQQFPNIFSNASTWRSFDGFFYKYFSISGVFVGINGDDLYLLGGQFGDVATYAGKVADAIVVLGGGPGVSSPLFNDLVTASTLSSLIGYFKTITVSYDTITSAFSLLSSVALEVQGQESVNGKSAQKLLVTISGNNLPQPTVAQMWVDDNGIIIKLILNGGEFPESSSNLIGTGLVSSMLLALKSAESPIIQTAITQELANPSVDTKVFDNVISGLSVKTLAIEVGDAQTARVLFEISDFGGFSITTKLESTIAGATSRFELKDLVLR